MMKPVASTICIAATFALGASLLGAQQNCANGKLTAYSAGDVSTSTSPMSCRAAPTAMHSRSTGWLRECFHARSRMPAR